MLESVKEHKKMLNFSFKKPLRSAAKTLAALALIGSVSGLPALASSHAEAPMISMDRFADNTDVYAFRSSEA